MARWQSCNVLHVGKEGRQVWQFSATGGKLGLQRHELKLPNEPLPAKIIRKDWQALLQPKLNIAWLPPEHVFLRVIQMPKADAAETHSMVELQLEKLSPMPVGQIVWSYEAFPHAAGELQTVILVIVARNLVDDYLGKIEGQGYLADRLELPLLEELRAMRGAGDGLKIFPGLGVEKDYCLLAWRSGGVLCHVSLLKLPEESQRVASIQEHLAQVAWAGELEGWVSGALPIHVVADAATAEPWLQELIRESSALVEAPLPAHDLATQTARRVTSNGATTNLLPAEFAARYRQMFIDRLWMRSLAAVFLVYLLGVGIYFGMVEVARWQLDGLKGQVTSLGNSYTNAIRMKEHVKALRDQVDLQYSALDCYRAVAENLNIDLTLNILNFDRGRKLTLTGSAPNDALPRVQGFVEALQASQANDQPLFSKIKEPSISPGRAPGMMTWTIPCDLKSVETE